MVVLPIAPNDIEIAYAVIINVKFIGAVAFIQQPIYLVDYLFYSKHRIIPPTIKPYPSYY